MHLIVLKQSFADLHDISGAHSYDKIALAANVDYFLLDFLKIRFVYAFGSEAVYFFF